MVGGDVCAEALKDRLAAKYPHLRNYVTSIRARELFETTGYVAEDYGEEIKRWEHRDYAAKQTYVIQCPYVKPVGEHMSCGAQGSDLSYFWVLPSRDAYLVYLLCVPVSLLFLRKSSRNGQKNVVLT